MEMHVKPAHAVRLHDWMEKEIEIQGIRDDTSPPAPCQFLSKPARGEIKGTGKAHSIAHVTEQRVA